MKTVKRFDIATLGSAERTPQGFLRIPVYATRSGVFKYKTQDGRTIREFRPPDEVFSEDSMKTLRGAPVTLRHPPVMVGPDNVKDFMKGYLSDDVKRDEDKLSAVAYIADALAISAVEKDGLREVSCGYLADLEESPGEYEGEGYDYVQRNIRYNHLAIVDRGRAGPEVRLRLDGDDAVAESMTHNQPFKEETKMVKVMLAGQEFEVEPKLAEALAAHMAQMEDGMKKQKADLDVAAKKEKDEMQAKCDALSDELKARKDEAPTEEKIRERVKGRLAVEKVAAYLGIEKADELSDLDLKKAVVKHDSSTVELEGKSEEYVSARFDIVAEKVRGTKDFSKVLGQSIASAARKDSEVDSEAARKRMIERDNLAWKPAEKK
jgi:hypothetical protein